MIALPHGARLLIVRMGALGDIVHALPVLAALRAHRPDVEVDWLVDARYATVLTLVDGLRHRVIVRAASRGQSGADVRFPGVAGFLPAVRFLRARGYAAALDLQGLVKSAVLARASGAARVVGFVRSQLREPAAALCYTDAVTGPVGGHVVQKNLTMLDAVGVPSAGVVFPWKAVVSAVATAIGTEAAGSRAGGFAVLNPGAAWENKRWPPHRFGELAARLGAELGLPSVVTWGPAERPLADEVVSHAGGHATATPQTSLADLIALSARARLVVSGDTGPLHLAASVGAPLVGLFGPTRPERNGPWRAADVCVSRAATCVCFHKRRCVRGRACIEDIAAAEVFDACRRRLGERRS